MTLPSWFWPLLVAASLAACDRASPVKPPAKEDAHADENLVKLSAEEIARAGVLSEPLEERELRDELVVTAVIHPNRDRLAQVAPRVAGRLLKVHAGLGDRVKAGQVLAVLDSLEIGGAHAAYLQSLSDASLSQAAFQRAERLHRDEVIPAKDFERARAEDEKAQAAMRAAADKLRLLGVAPHGKPGQPAVSTFPLLATQGGTVIEKHAVAGELADTGKPVFTVADLSVVWVEADVLEKDLGRVRLGAPAQARVAAYPDEAFKGKVAYIGATLAKETRTVRARIEIANADGRLKPGMFATAAIETGGAVKVLAVPEAAVTLVRGIPTVFVEEGAGFEPRPVERGDARGGAVILKSGVKAGELVVTQGTYALKARLLKSQIGEGHAH